MTGTQDLWVFGYGSLMWNPGFDHIEALPARMNGVHRAPCIYSWVHRGTRERPGIVLGLAQGGSCQGIAFRVAFQDRNQVIQYLRDRELVTDVYLERTRRIQLMGGKKVDALTYIADVNHEQFAGRLSHEDLVRRIKGSVGKSGNNEDYMLGTAEQLRKMGIRDTLIESIVREL